MKVYKIGIEINASKEIVWYALTDFEQYPKWNSILTMKNNDNIVLGQKFDVEISQPKHSHFKATAISKDIYQSFSASQTILGQWFFQAMHYFIIEEIDKDHVTFVQKWELKGIIAKLFYKLIIKQLEVFKKMNIELKELVENK